MAEEVIPEGFKKTEVGVFPKDWDIQFCSALSERIMVGIVIRPSQYYVKSGIPAFRSANIRESGINNSDLVFISEKSNDLLAKSQTREGDVLTVRTGYPGTSAVVRSDHAGCNCIDILITRPSRRVSPEYLSIWVNSTFGKDQVLMNQGGLAQQHFNVGDMKNLIVALPKLPEQRAIATALSDIDALIAGLDQLIAKKRAIKQAAMQQLLTGQKRLPGFQGDWETKKLGDCLMSFPSYGINAAAVPYSDRKPAYIRITDISVDGRFQPETLVSVDSSRSGQYYLQDGDIVFARTGASVGKSYRYRVQDGKLVFAGFLIRAHPNPKVLSPYFLSEYVKTEAYWKWIKLMSMRSGQPGVNGNEFAQLPIPLPTIQEQTAIATILSDMDSELAALEHRRDKTRLLKQGMMQELLTGRIRLVDPTPSHTVSDLQVEPNGRRLAVG
ncbi:MAG: restriction endonuclease subunit S [Fibrobacterota bacterium]|nr:restriction endonuclease subunit S [Fibrobacterota bacterium]